MKRISGIIGLAVSLFITPLAAAGEYDLLNGPVTLVAYNDIQISSFKAFVAALDESREYASQAKEKARHTSYKNVHSFESFTAMLVDNYDGKAHGTVSIMEGPLIDDYSSERYDAIMDRSRFTALQDNDGCGGVQADLLSDPDRAQTGCI